MTQTFFALVVFLFPLAFSPGPGNVFFAASGARFGFAATLPANAGYHVATWIVTAAIGLGFVAALDRFPSVFVAIKVAGGLYVLWIAWKLAKSGKPGDGVVARPATFSDGAILLLLNPKAYMIVALMFTQFLHATDTGLLVPVLFITTVFTFNNLVAFIVWTLVGDRISAFFQTDVSARRMNRTFGSILAAVGLWMLLS